MRTLHHLFSWRWLNGAGHCKGGGLPVRVAVRAHLLRALSVLFLTSGVAMAQAPAPQPAQPAPGPVQAAHGGPVPADAALLEKGRYLAIAGDCMACHTAAGGKPFAGGYSVQSPLGVIVATNITPSTTAGIGHYTEAQFSRALRQGVRADGQHLYPAMPYTAYTLMSDEDTHALYTYFLRGVEPVDVRPPLTGLPFPFDIRLSMAAWNIMFLRDERFVPDAAQSQQVNRGAYVANALAHCSTCHTPRNALMAERSSKLLGGGQLGPWYAPNISSDSSGIGGWSDTELLAYLQTGHVTGKSQAAGPMAEAIEKSLQHLRVDDVAAVVAWLKTVPPVKDDTEPRPRYARGMAGSVEPALRGASGPNELHSLTSGSALFSGNCASCHQADASGGRDQFYPSLFNNTATGAGNASNLVATILYGVERTIDGHPVMMPRFDKDSPVNPLSDTEVASIANYILTQYGNPDVQVVPDDVKQAREGGPRPLLATLQPVFAPLAFLLPLIVIALVIWFLVRRRRSRRAAYR